MQKQKILVLFDSAGTPPENQDYSTVFADDTNDDWITEKNVIEALSAMDYIVKAVGVYDDPRLITDSVNEFSPHLVFNLTEVFLGKAQYDKNVVGLLELLQVSYTGCNPVGLAVCNNKGLSKKILSYHHCKVPDFQIFPMRKRIWLPRRLNFPMVVKPISEEASTGIAQASYVENEKDFKERVKFIHENLGQNAMAEEYIDGRELYVSVMGNQKLEVFPIRETVFDQVPDDEPKMATYRAKWDKKYRQRWGIKDGFANKLPEGIPEKIAAACKKAYGNLLIDGYARFDIRLTQSNEIFILEANPNPMLARNDDFAQAAAASECTYEVLLQKIINLALSRS